MKPASFSALALGLGLGLVPALLGACRSAPDLAPVRADLAKNAAVVCAPVPARPSHGVAAREVPADETQAALVKLCDAPLDDAAPRVVHDALLGPRATVGELRRSHLAEEGGSGTKAPCSAASPGLDQTLLDGATRAKAAGNMAGALERCADVVALARDEDLTGNLTDLLLANGQLQRAVATCLPFVDDAKPAEAASFARALAVLRASFPKTLDDVLRRERAELVVVSLGKARTEGQKLGCARADTLAASPAAVPPSEADLVARWHALQAEPLPANAKYLEAYTMTLGALDRLISLAEVKGR